MSIDLLLFFLLCSLITNQRIIAPTYAQLIKAPWRSGYHYCTTSFKKVWTQALRRFKSCSPRVRDSRWWRRDLWQWSWLEIKLNVFCQSTIPQKKIIITIIVIITSFHYIPYVMWKLKFWDTQLSLYERWIWN